MQAHLLRSAGHLQAAETAAIVQSTTNAGVRGTTRDKIPADLPNGAITAETAEVQKGTVIAAARRVAITTDTHLSERAQQVDKLNAHAQQARCCFPGCPGAQQADDQQHGQAYSAGWDAWPHQNASAEPQQAIHHQQGHGAWPQQEATGWEVWPQQRPAAETQQSTEQEQGHADSAAWSARPQQSTAAEGHHFLGPQYEQAYGGSWELWPQQGATTEAQPMQGDQEWNLRTAASTSRNHKYCFA